MAIRLKDTTIREDNFLASITDFTETYQGKIDFCVKDNVDGYIYKKIIRYNGLNYHISTKVEVIFNSVLLSIPDINQDPLRTVYVFKFLAIRRSSCETGSDNIIIYNVHLEIFDETVVSNVQYHGNSFMLSKLLIVVSKAITNNGAKFESLKEICEGVRRTIKICSL